MAQQSGKFTLEFLLRSSEFNVLAYLIFSIEIKKKGPGLQDGKEGQTRPSHCPDGLKLKKVLQ